MTPKTQIILDLLRRSGETRETRQDGSVWVAVYLDNAKPDGISGRAFAGHLSVLENLGFYQQEQGYTGFGWVRIN
jgi:hypothetical protein